MKDQKTKEQQRYTTLRQKITQIYEEFLQGISPENKNLCANVITQLPTNEDPDQWRSYKDGTLIALKSSLMYKNKTPDEKKAFEMLDTMQNYCVRVLIGKTVDDEWFVTKLFRKWFKAN